MTAAADSNVAAFSATDFDQVLADFESPNLDGWERVTETGGVTIYRRPHEASTSGLYEYKAVGEVEGMNAETAFQVYLDLAYRRKWDNLKPEHLRVRLSSTASAKPNVLAATKSQDSIAVSDPDIRAQIRATEEDLSRPESIYWRVPFPMLMSDRDYVLVREAREMSNSHGQSCYVVMLCTDEVGIKHEPEVSGVIRVTDYRQTVVFCPGSDPESTTQVYVQYYDDPKTAIPSAVVNLVASKLIPQFLKNVKNACKNYKTDGAVVGSGKGGSTDEGVKELQSALDDSLATAFRL
ncbi:hypothetical protein BCR44DRAFT_64383 [Catenaria anguillulae PL171]|uniref:START domain-containing protein n=1 Tax=Catenaria anguillulae PL171 TaxID=765915 RepID=A0A1Y2I4D0_9FUNG|nr:hypothetical protein BCR44DRAFT_64383 [Catenaria anguillulae PL171]